LYDKEKGNDMVKKSNYEIFKGTLELGITLLTARVRQDLTILNFAGVPLVFLE